MTFKTLVKNILLTENFDNTKPSLTITVGISGSGKSTWINSQTIDGMTKIVSPDSIRKELTGNVSDQTQNKKVFEIAYKRTIDYLNNDINVIFDATNLSSFGRKKMLDTFKNSVNIEFDTYAKIFDSDPELSKKRIQKDIESGVDRSNVPPEIIDRQYNTFKQDLNKIEDDGYTIIN